MPWVQQSETVVAFKNILHKSIIRPLILVCVNIGHFYPICHDG